VPPVDDERAAEAGSGRGQRENYATTANLAKRQALFSFPDPSRSSGKAPIERIAWTGRERVLDAGCGNGIWLGTLRNRFGVRDAVGLDLSAAMLEGARVAIGDNPALVLGDVQRLPFADECFDVVLCFWMLYHVADHGSALREIKRVLRPGGRLLAVTNSEAPRPLDDVIAAALHVVTGQTRDRWTPTLSFSSENGAAILGEVFDRVEEDHVVSAFAISTPDPVLDAIESLSGPIDVFTGLRIDWEAVARAAPPVIERVIARDGAFRTAAHSASFLAHN
jgi:SAM-dependent methyltransferase